MKRALGVVALALGLGGWLSEVRGQMTVWRPVVRPAASRPAPRPSPPPVTARASPLAPSACLGRPTGWPPVSGAGVEPRPFPVEYRAEVVRPAAALPAGVEPIATVPPPGAVIAVSAPPPAALALPVASALEEQQDLFASDRDGPPLQRLALIEGLPAEPGRPGVLPPTPLNWRETFPVTPPAQTADPAEPGGDSEGPPPAFYARAEYLLWWTKNDKAPPLVTTGTPTSLADPTVGALGRPDTRILQDGRLDRGAFSGGRFTVGCFLDDCAGNAVELSGFFLGSKSFDFQASAPFNGVIARPFFAVNPGLIQNELRQLVALPNVACGGILIHAPSQLWGLETNLTCKACCGCDYRANWLVGARYLSLRESLDILEVIQFAPLPPGSPPSPFNGTLNMTNDHFATSNQFYGAQVGAQGYWDMGGGCFLGGVFKLAAGVTRQEVSISGFQTFTPVTGPISPLPGGLLALGSNIGTFRRDRFAVVPELGLTVGYDLTDCVRLSVGYNFLYWSSVVRPGGQVDRNLDITRIPNFDTTAFTLNGLPATPVAQPFPRVLFKDTDYWAQGLTVGVEFRY